LQRMAKRAIEPEWIERVIRAPALRLDDDNDRGCIAVSEGSGINY
jgi:hypothetical protein